MRIAIVSGKGGAGKTTVTVNLSAVCNNISVIDCDVEEPNCHIFLKPHISEIVDVFTEYPEIDKSLCINCGACSSFCKFNAFLSSKNLTISMKELCHSCGGCIRVCKENAIKYSKRSIGSISSGKSEGLDNKNDFHYGVLNIGEMSGVKIVEQLKKKCFDNNLLLIDSPPGTACLAVSAVEGSDFAVIVLEPSLFGISDMEMVIEMLNDLKIPFGVVINKIDSENEIYNYCIKNKLIILGEIPFISKIAEINAKGELLTSVSVKYKELFQKIYQNILKQVSRLAK